jgi:hypothetical protein
VFADDAYDVLLVPQQTLEGGLHSDVDDPHR